MIAQFILSGLLLAVLIYAWHEHRKFPVVATLAAVVVMGGMFLVWNPADATLLAEMVGIGRGVDLILYTWVCISFLLLLNLHLKLRSQVELITALARAVALADVQSNKPSTP
jgi:hypothetical protein